MGIKTTIASTIVALFAAFAAPLTPASAHAHAAISVTDVKLTRSDANGNPIASPLRNDDIASFSFTWSAGDAAVSEGESITVGLPEFFGNLDYGRAAALTAQRMGSTVPIGTCAIAKRSLACTFAKGLNALRGLAASPAASAAAESPLPPLSPPTLAPPEPLALASGLALTLPSS